MRTIPSILFLAMSVISLAATADDGARQSLTLSQVVSGKVVSPRAESERERTIQEYGLRAGAAGGFAERATELESEISRRARDMDSLFMFQAIIDKSGLLPPVIEETTGMLTVKEDRLEAAGKIYKILQKARFSLTTPTWRDYLPVGLKNRDEVEYLPRSLQPKNDSEKHKWEDAVKEGWRIGRERADDVFNANLARMRRDYLGMLRYVELVKMKIVQPPVVASSDQAYRVTNDEAAMGLVTHQVTAPAAMESAHGKWRSGVVLSGAENSEQK